MWPCGRELIFRPRLVGILQSKPDRISHSEAGQELRCRRRDPLDLKGLDDSVERRNEANCDRGESSASAGAAYRASHHRKPDGLGKLSDSHSARRRGAPEP